MVGVSFYLSDTPPNLRQQILQTTMQYQVCKDHCQSYGKCSQNTIIHCPKFTEQTMYIIKYIAAQNQMTNTIYPYPGT